MTKSPKNKTITPKNAYLAIFTKALLFLRFFGVYLADHFALLLILFHFAIYKNHFTKDPLSIKIS